MIQLENVTFGYGRKRKVFEELTLSLTPGHIHGVLGLNGVGKSSLLRLICGLVAPDAGRIAVLGHAPQRRSPEMLARLMFLPEELNLPEIPLRRFAALTGAFYPAYSAADFERHCSALEIDPAQRPGSMSAGQRKKGYIAFALACNTPILLLDEPTNGLDIPSKAALRRLLAAQADAERTIVLSTHQIREVESLIDQVVILGQQGLLLSAATENLARRLCFGPLPAGAPALYRETSLSGERGITVNDSGAESLPDLEMLFEAVMHDPATISELLHANADNHE